MATYEDSGEACGIVNVEEAEIINRAWEALLCKATLRPVSGLLNLSLRRAAALLRTTVPDSGGALEAKRTEAESGEAACSRERAVLVATVLENVAAGHSVSFAELSDAMDFTQATLTELISDGCSIEDTF